jgi:hypothetical protein
MQEVTFEGITALLILLPGFLAAELVRILSSRPKRSEFDKIVQAFIYSFLVYVIFSGVSSSFPITVHVEKSAEGATHYFPEFHFGALVAITVIAIMLAIVVATMMNNDFPLSLLRKIGMTQRTFRPSVWADVFRLPSQYVQVELADGRQVIGWLVYFSDTPKEAALYLEDAAWLKSDSTQIPIEGPGILLTKETGIKAIMFLNAVDQSNPSANQDTASLPAPIS